jgi:hypothetical protein
MLLYTTDAGFHHAGDGKVNAINRVLNYKNAVSAKLGLS